MGRYLAVGVSTTIKITKTKNEWGNFEENIDLEKEKNNILQELNKLLDVSKYKVKYDDKRIYLELEPEHYNNNIHDLLQELTSLLNINYFTFDFMEEIKNFKKELTKEKYPIQIKRNKEGVLYEEYTNSKENFVPFQDPSYFLFQSGKYKWGLTLDIWYIPLWIHIDKFGFSESEEVVIKLLNIMLKKCLKSTLSKNILFYIHE